MRGGEHVEVPEAGPGDVVAVAKLKHVHTGDALTAEKGGIALAPMTIPQGVISYAIRAKSKGDEDKVFTSLGRLVEEDPTLQLGRDPSTGEYLLTGRGELHVRMTVHKLHRMFGVDVDLRTPKVPYRETVRKKAENVEGKLKKQSGGKGMFGVCYLTIEPLPRGAGIEFSDEIVGGSIPRNLIPAVEKGVIEAARARDRSRATRWSTCACAASTASTTRSTRTRWRSSSPARSASRPGSRPPRRRCSSRS